MFSVFKAARLLGWTSLGVAATELVSTKWLEETMGVDNHGPLLKAHGLREAAAGVTILNQVGLTPSLVGGLWSRVAGDVMDLVTLGLLAKVSKRPEGISLVTTIVLAVTGIDLVVAAVAQADLVRGNQLSAAAKSRVVPTDAVPVGSDTRVSQVFVR